jgi:hypothetical protein
MSDLKNLIRRSKSKEKLIASTIRLSEEHLSFIVELEELLGLSKQEVMRKLIQEGISVAEKEFNSNNDEEFFIEEELANEKERTFYYLLNTNKSNNLEESKRMILHGTASAFCNPWKFEVEKIKAGDTVFLYENGVGIVGYGKATGEVFKREHGNEIDGCFYQKLQNYKKLDKPVSAKAIKKVLDRNFPFLKTMSMIYDGHKILDLIEK